MTTATGWITAGASDGTISYFAGGSTVAGTLGGLQGAGAYLSLSPGAVAQVLVVAAVPNVPALKGTLRLAVAPGTISGTTQPILVGFANAQVATGAQPPNAANADLISPGTITFPISVDGDGASLTSSRVATGLWVWIKNNHTAAINLGRVTWQVTYADAPTIGNRRPIDTVTAPAPVQWVMGTYDGDLLARWEVKAFPTQLVGSAFDPAAPGTVPAVIDSAATSTAITTSPPGPFPAGDYELFIRATAKGAVGAWTRTRFNVPSSSAPATPTVTAGTEAGRVRLNVSGPTGATVVAERSVDGGITWAAVRLADPTGAAYSRPWPGAAGGVWWDYEAPAGRADVQYRARVVNASGVAGPWGTASCQAPTGGRWQLAVATNPLPTWVALYTAGDLGVGRPDTVGVAQPARRARPVVVAGAAQPRRWTISVVAAGSDSNRIDRLASSVGTLLLRTPTGEVVFVRLDGDVQLAEPAGSARVGAVRVRTCQLTVVEVGPSSADVAVPAGTAVGLAGSYAAFGLAFPSTFPDTFA